VNIATPTEPVISRQVVNHRYGVLPVVDSASAGGMLDIRFTNARLGLLLGEFINYLKNNRDFGFFGKATSLTNQS
jgi:hypothetical protein